MNIQRLNQLLEFYKEDPSDPFVIYGLATEYASDKNWEKAIFYYDLLLKAHESYTGTYYHAAIAYIEIDNREEAEEIYKKGLVVCEREKDHHALKELRNAYTNFQLDDDDEW
ncbi:tetratricopeptide repeat protein [Flammeovirga sp. MY04]|uniref:tetratricopeptide repeat protein n=1 Tax=Flammeovirga sp. MY04 TaxID=1191459 RepID=UPI0008061907|nr:hypothetical protein [Flammeovirga sp. MY04]ANQ48369.1 tetratricopeptide repeat protein [Flammeovirga sp. MY04]